MFNLCLAEEAGGVGLGLTEAALVFEELGRALVPGPLVASHLAAGLVDGADDGSVVVGLIEATPAAANTTVSGMAASPPSSSGSMTSTSSSSCPTKGSRLVDPRSLEADPAGATRWIR